MRDAVGNELQTGYENSIQGRTYIIADKLQKALYALAHIEMDWKNGNDTKANMLNRMGEVEETILAGKKEIMRGSLGTNGDS